MSWWLKWRGGRAITRREFRVARGGLSAPGAGRPGVRALAAEVAEAALPAVAVGHRRGKSPAAMPEEPTQAQRFSKARSAQSAALLEDYAELIADLLASAGEARPVDIARRLGVSHATVAKSIARLKREGLVTARPYRGVFLTEAGRALAERVRARHRLVVDVLVALGVPLEAAEADAEGIEHHVSDVTLKSFARFLHAGS